MEDVMGRLHPNVLTPRYEQAAGVAKLGQVGEAIELLKALSTDQVQQLGKEHRSVQKTERLISLLSER